MSRGKNNEKCHHFNGIQNKCCDAGVDYDTLRSSDRRIPCLPPHRNEERPAAHCEKFRPSTPEEIAKRDAEIAEAIARMELTLPLISKIKQEHAGTSWEGTVECPVCAGKLRISHAAYNGHVHGRCETDGCLAWME